jgi:predicted nucleic acid-binding protein
MQILVSDTSVIIDLERANLLEQVFETSMSFVMPDLLFEREFPTDGQRLLDLGLEVLSLDSKELTYAQVTHQTIHALSLPDCFALVLSTRPDHLLLTGDKALRTFAESQQVECHGILWLLDQLYATNRIPQTSLAKGLTALAAHPRCRLPRNEIAKRLLRWQKEKA